MHWFTSSERQRKKVEEKRAEVLSEIRGQRLSFDRVVERLHAFGESVDPQLIATVLSCLAEIQQQAKEETDIDQLEELIWDAEQQGQMRALVCPSSDVETDGNLRIDLMEEIGVSKTVTTRLRGLCGQRLANVSSDLHGARAALRTIFEEYDSWASYTQDYEETMGKYAKWLLGITIFLLMLTLVAFHFSPTFIVGFSLAGAAGACVSIMRRMPALEIDPSGKLESYFRRTLGRVAVGMSASVVGCALLGWGLLQFSIQGQSFSEVINACAPSFAATYSPSTCTQLKALILVAVPFLFGFSERALTSLEHRMFGERTTRRSVRPQS
jgi:hypothetical protein